ncbi:MAG: hypothetical protein ACJ79A_03110 [Gemmatimonadaceae bacterium]
MPTPSRVGAVPAHAVRATRGPAALFARAALLLGIAALPIAFSAWIDPARLVAPRVAEREIARVLATGTNVTNYANYDDRAIEKQLASMRARPEVLVLGSSRMQVLRGFAGSRVRGFADEKPIGFVNGAMQGAVLDDMLGVYGLYDAPERRPNRVLIGVDPWTESASGEGWRSLASERALVLRRAGIPASPRREELALWARSVRTLATPEYFRLAVFSFRRYGAQGIAWQPTDRAQNVEKTKLPDGSVVWSAVPDDNAERAATRFVSTELARDARFHGFKRRPPGRDDALERFMRYLQSEGVSSTVVLVPFPAAVYDASRRMSGDSLASVERRVRTIAARTGARVVGSYDPRRAGVVTRDFFDEDHLRPEPLALLVSR